MKCHWAILFEDADRRPEIFMDEKSARATYEQRLENWNCHLFQQVLPARESQQAPPLAVEDAEFVFETYRKANVAAQLCDWKDQPRWLQHIWEDVTNALRSRLSAPRITAEDNEEWDKDQRERYGQHEMAPRITAERYEKLRAFTDEAIGHGMIRGNNYAEPGHFLDFGSDGVPWWVEDKGDPPRQWSGSDVRFVPDSQQATNDAYVRSEVKKAVVAERKRNQSSVTPKQVRAMKQAHVHVGNLAGCEWNDAMEHVAVRMEALNG